MSGQGNRFLRSGRPGPGTRLLLLTVCLCASALRSLRAGQLEPQQVTLTESVIFVRETFYRTKRLDTGAGVGVRGWRTQEMLRCCGGEAGRAVLKARGELSSRETVCLGHAWVAHRVLGSEGKPGDWVCQLEATVPLSQTGAGIARAGREKESVGSGSGLTCRFSTLLFVHYSHLQDQSWHCWLNQ